MIDLYVLPPRALGLLVPRVRIMDKAGKVGWRGVVVRNEEKMHNI